MDLIDTTSFTAGTKRFVEDMEAKMEIVEPAAKQEIKKKEQESIDADEKKMKFQEMKIT